MGLNDDRIKAMKYDHPEFIPVTIGTLPSAWMKYREALRDIARRYPAPFEGQDIEGRDFDDPILSTFVEGEHVDAWGCVWTNVCRGQEAMVTGHPVPRREMVHALKAPTEFTGLPHGFMYLRLADLRGFQEIMMDFAMEAPELQMLIDLVLEHNLRQLPGVFEIYARDYPETKFIWCGDDQGTQHGLPISPALWRKYLKPCYRKIYQAIHEGGFLVMMHTDGHCYEIIPDLAECGVDVINPQFRANGLDNLVATCKGKICVNLDLDRQMFPFCKPEAIDPHVREAVEKLGAPEGGLWLSVEVGPDVPLATIEALAAALEKYRGYYR